MEVLGRRLSRWQRGLGEALVLRRGPRRVGKLADRGSVGGDERRQAVELGDLHGR
jgi:hypothetical protein